MTDTGKYGSGTFFFFFKPKSQQIQVALEQWNVKFVHFDPTLYSEFPDHRGFVAAVEQEFLSHADYLILMGGGGFTKDTALLFTTRHHDNVDHLFHVCNLKLN